MSTLNLGLNDNGGILALWLKIQKAGNGEADPATPTGSAAPKDATATKAGVGLADGSASLQFADVPAAEGDESQSAPAAGEFMQLKGGGTAFEPSANLSTLSLDDLYFQVLQETNDTKQKSDAALAEAAFKKGLQPQQYAPSAAAIADEEARKRLKDEGPERAKDTRAKLAAAENLDSIPRDHSHERPGTTRLDGGLHGDRNSTGPLAQTPAETAELTEASEATTPAPSVPVATAPPATTPPADRLQQVWNTLVERQKARPGDPGQQLADRPQLAARPLLQEMRSVLANGGSQGLSDSVAAHLQNTRARLSPADSQRADQLKAEVRAGLEDAKADLPAAKLQLLKQNPALEQDVNRTLTQMSEFVGIHNQLVRSEDRAKAEEARVVKAAADSAPGQGGGDLLGKVFGATDAKQIDLETGVKIAKSKTKELLDEMALKEAQYAQKIVQQIIALREQLAALRIVAAVLQGLAAMLPCMAMAGAIAQAMVQNLEDKIKTLETRLQESMERLQQLHGKADNQLNVMNESLKSDRDSRGRILDGGKGG